MILIPWFRRHRVQPSWRRHALAAVAVLLVSGMTACGPENPYRHEALMRGHILESTHEGLILCVGEKDGARVGQVLAAISHRRLSDRGPQAGSRYQRQPTGTVRITALRDDHYAVAEVVDGKPGLHDTVELVRP
jgi:hypothetical protein